MRGVALSVLLVGCGYGWVRPDAVPAPRLGIIADTSPDGQLGLRAAAHLRRLAAGRETTERRLAGRIEVGSDEPAGWAADGRSAFFRAPVVLVLEETDADRATWRTRTAAVATWARGPDPLATATARQLALGDAAEAAADAAWQRLLARGAP